MLPDSLEELQEEVEERIGQANRIVCPNPHVLQQFQERQEQIRSMQRKVECDRQQLEGLRTEVERVQQLEELKSEVERVQGIWLPRLRSLIVRINEAFSRNFQELAVAGEVALVSLQMKGGLTFAHTAFESESSSGDSASGDSVQVAQQQVVQSQGECRAAGLECTPPVWRGTLLFKGVLAVLAGVVFAVLAGVLAVLAGVLAVLPSVVCGAAPVVVALALLLKMW
ncbi:unnamed protein product [Closterium sp. Naga37s-1]|nr:unnamed protein product [Closterium sp. Naga37s-1]